MEFHIALPTVAALLGSAYLWSERAADAVPLLEEAVEAITAMRVLGLRSWFITFLAEAYLVPGQVAKAREQAEQAVALARAHQQRGSEAWGLKVLGDIHAHEPTEIRARRRHVSAGVRARDRSRHAPARRPLSLRPRQPLPTNEQARSSTRALHNRYRDVPRNGHAILAGAGGGRSARAGLSYGCDCQ